MESFVQRHLLRTHSVLTHDQWRFQDPIARAQDRDGPDSVAGRNSHYDAGYRPPTNPGLRSGFSTRNAAPKLGDRTAENCLLQMCHRLIRLILRAAIFDESVVGRIPSSSAAPSDP